MARLWETETQVSKSKCVRCWGTAEGRLTFGPVPPVTKDLVLKDTLPPPPLLVNSKVVTLFRGSGSNESSCGTLFQGL